MSMTQEPLHPEVAPPARDSSRGSLRRDVWAAAVAACVTIAVELGVYYGWGGCGAGTRGTFHATLMAMVLWVIVSAGPLAAGGRTWLGILLRGGIVADASLVALVVLWLRTPYLNLLDVLLIYCTLAVLAIACVAAVSMARTAGGRFATATIAMTVTTAAAASPFWVGGLLQVTHGTLKDNIVAAAVWANPIYAVMSTLGEESAAFVWHQATVMYQITRIGDFAAPPPVPWYAAVVVYGVVSMLLAAVAILRRILFKTKP